MMPENEMSGKAQELSENELQQIAGGDQGDSEMESRPDGSVAFKYNVGDTVEVYRSGWHIRTIRGTIIARDTTDVMLHGGHLVNVGNYTVQLENGNTVEVTLDDIER